MSRTTPVSRGLAALLAASACAAAWAGGDAAGGVNGDVKGDVNAQARGELTAALQTQTPAQPEAAAGAEPSPPPAVLPPLPAPVLSQRPLWELGAGVAGVYLPDYRGADQGRGYLLPLPYLVYRGKWLKSDREGARAMLLDAPRAKVDVSLAVTAPTRRDGGSARAGMPSVPGILEVGPNLNLTLAASTKGGWKLDLRLPVRAAFTLQSSPDFAGTTFSPNLNLDLNNVAGGWNLGLLTGPLFADRKYNGLVYGVDAAHAKASRPAYDAPGGYAGWQALAAASRRFGDAWVGAFLRYDDLRGAAFEDSPLVRRRSALTAGLGVSWVFTTSKTLVPSTD